MRRHAVWVPVILLLSAATTTSAGLAGSSATAASTGNVTVSATVLASLSVGGCAGASVTFSAVTTSTANTATCNVTFGASNHSSVNLTMEESAGSAADDFFEQGNSDATIKIADKAVCGPLSTAANEGGVDVILATAGVGTNVFGPGDCPTPGDSDGFPNASGAAPVYCDGDGGTGASNYTCRFRFGIGQDANGSPAAAYQGLAAFTAIQV